MTLLRDREIAIAANAIMDERDRITYDFASTIDPITGKRTFPWPLRAEYAIRLAEAALADLDSVPDIDEEMVREIMAEIGISFTTFGGGKEPTNPYARSPITAALKDKPLQFAMGVDVESVVRLVLYLSQYGDRGGDRTRMPPE